MDREAFMSAMAEVLDVSREEIAEQTPLDEGNWDSLAHLAAISVLDERFGVSVPATELMRVRTVGDLMSLVERNAAPPSD